MIEAGAEVLRYAGAGLSDGGREAAEDVLLAALERSIAFQEGELIVLRR